MTEDIVKGIYPYFALLAAAGIFIRIRRREWTSAESVVIVLFAVHGVLTVFQVGCFGTEWNFSRRYLLPAAPLLFGWAGYALRIMFGCRIVRWLLIPAVLLLVSDAVRPSLEHHWNRKKKHRFRVVETFVPVMKADWKGAVRYEPELWWDEYRPPKRPVVQCAFPEAGYFSGGRFWTPESTERIPPDYILLDGSAEPPPGYSRIESAEIDSVVYTLWKK